MSQFYPSDADRDLQTRTVACDRLAKAFDDWIAAFAGPRAGTRDRLPPTLAAQLRLRRRAIKNLRMATSVPVALAVYGASQSGKSLTLGRMIACLPGRPTALGFSREDAAPVGLDFLKHLNPRWGVEATAVVTRFSLGSRIPPELVHRDYPVIGRFLSRSDLIKSMARGFKGECCPAKSWDEEAVERLLKDELTPKYNASSVDTDWCLDICDAIRFMVVDYRDQTIETSEDAVAELLHRYPLTNSGYIAFCAHFFWEDWSALTGLFGDLVTLRAKLPPEIEVMHLSWSAVPFILDSTLPETCDRSPVLPPSSWSDFRLHVEAARVVLGKQAIGANVNLAILQGLLAEIHVPLIKENLSPVVLPLFESADVLDIPGARSGAGRAAMTFQQFEETRNSQPTEVHVLKRGRIGLLFEKYAQEQQIAAVLYLQRWGNQETKSEIVPQLHAWGRARYGENWPTRLSPEDVASPALFIALTQIDKNSAWESNANSSSFENVIQKELASPLSDFMNGFGDPSGTFKNVYLLRNPGPGADDDKTNPFLNETALMRWCEAFQQSAGVARYVGDPRSKWSAAFSNDGGVSFLVERMCQCLDNEARREWLSEQVANEENVLRAEMQRLCIDTSPQAEAERIAHVADAVIGWLGVDRTGRRARDLRDALACDAAFIDGAVHDAQLAEDHTSLVPLRRDFERITRGALDKWLSSRNWSDCVRHRGDCSLNEDTFHFLAGYLHQYVTQHALSSIASALYELDSALGDMHKSRRFRRYACMVVGDALFTPGPRELPSTSSFADGVYSFAEATHERYARILKDRLLTIIDSRVLHPPVGNDQLAALLNRS